MPPACGIYSCVLHFAQSVVLYSRTALSTCCHILVSILLPLYMLTVCCVASSWCGGCLCFAFVLHRCHAIHLLVGFAPAFIHVSTFVCFCSWCSYWSCFALVLHIPLSVLLAASACYFRISIPMPCLEQIKFFFAGSLLPLPATFNLVT